MKFNGLVIIVSFVVLLISFWHRNDLPANLIVLPETKQEPQQASAGKRGFAATYNDVEYRIEPEYSYDITGVVVSYRHHEGNSRMHRRANDHLNMLDVCVVWGDNAGNPALQNIKFWNGIFTCNVSTRDGAAWNAFQMEQLSNNHLISDSDRIRDRVQDVAIGDQIRVRGYLTSYSSEGGGKRGTSTTRLDTGDGACETIYVEQFEILQPALNRWRLTMYASLAILFGAIALYLKRPYRPYAEENH